MLCNIKEELVYDKMTADFMKSKKKEIFEIQKQLSVKQLCIKSYIHNLKKK